MSNRLQQMLTSEKSKSLVRAASRKFSGIDRDRLGWQFLGFSFVIAEAVTREAKANTAARTVSQSDEVSSFTELVGSGSDRTGSLGAQDDVQIATDEVGATHGGASGSSGKGKSGNDVHATDATVSGKPVDGPAGPLPSDVGTTHGSSGDPGIAASQGFTTALITNHHFFFNFQGGQGGFGFGGDGAGFGGQFAGGGFFPVFPVGAVPGIGPIVIELPAIPPAAVLPPPGPIPTIDFFDGNLTPYTQKLGYGDTVTPIVDAIAATSQPIVTAALAFTQNGAAPAATWVGFGQLDPQTTVKYGDTIASNWVVQANGITATGTSELQQSRGSTPANAQQYTSVDHKTVGNSATLIDAGVDGLLWVKGNYFEFNTIIQINIVWNNDTFTITRLGADPNVLGNGGGGFAAGTINTGDNVQLNDAKILDSLHSTAPTTRDFGSGTIDLAAIETPPVDPAAGTNTSTVTTSDQTAPATTGTGVVTATDTGTTTTAAATATGTATVKATAADTASSETVPATGTATTASTGTADLADTAALVGTATTGTAAAPGAAVTTAAVAVVLPPPDIAHKVVVGGITHNNAVIQLSNIVELDQLGFDLSDVITGNATLAAFAQFADVHTAGHIQANISEIEPAARTLGLADQAQTLAMLQAENVGKAIKIVDGNYYKFNTIIQLNVISDNDTKTSTVGAPGATGPAGGAPITSGGNIEFNTASIVKNVGASDLYVGGKYTQFNLVLQVNTLENDSNVQQIGKAGLLHLSDTLPVIDVNTNGNGKAGGIIDQTVLATSTDAVLKGHTIDL